MVYRDSGDPMRTINYRTAFKWLHRQILLFSKFGTVGIIAAFIDVILFNFLLGFMKYPPLESKMFSGLISTFFAWVGNRYWTFRAFRRSQRLTEVVEYFLVAAGGILISMGCLWISHYVLGYTSLVADNISGNIIGLILATAFRYFGNQYWVFSGKRRHNKTD